MKQKIYIRRNKGLVMRKILYIEDMEECHELTKEALGGSYEIDSAYTFEQAKERIIKNIRNYEAVISDVNLVYDETKRDNEQTKEGIDSIMLAREESKKARIKKLPIFCISSDGAHRKLSLKTGANIFMWKKEFWSGKGKDYMDRILNKRHGRQER